MAITRMNFRSKVLEKSTAVNVYLPDYSLEEYPVIYLLHGRSDDCNAWLNATSLERYAEFFPFAIVMPQVELSYYTDMIYGDNYWTYLTEELPEKMNDWYHLSHSWEKRFVAGNSMGGYGSFKWALTKPNYFNGAVSFSGALDVVDIWGKDPNRESDFAKIFGTKQQLSASNNNLMKCLEAANLSDNYTHFIQICGIEDFLYENNQRFRQRAGQNLLNYQYEEDYGGHDWHFWDEKIQDVLLQFSYLLEEQETRGCE